MSFEVPALVWGVLMSLSPLLQARRLWKQRSSADVSLPFLFVLLVGFTLYFGYGFEIGNRLLIITNAVSLVTYTVTVGVTLWYRRHPARDPDRVDAATP